jgi:glyoxylase-like metal-dependent hydrolase (beta-lactamase superfamily II)
MEIARQQRHLQERLRRVVGSDARRYLIDPGDEVDDLLDVIRRERLKVKAILLTHAHLDHTSGVGAKSV